MIFYNYFFTGVLGHTSVFDKIGLIIKKVVRLQQFIMIFISLLRPILY